MLQPALDWLKTPHSMPLTIRAVHEPRVVARMASDATESFVVEEMQNPASASHQTEAVLSRH